MISPDTFLKPWVLMWALCFALFFAGKWATWRPSRMAAVAPWRNAAYFFAWPGLDASAFLGGHRQTPRPSAHSWFCAVLNTLLGILLLWGLTSVVPAQWPLVKGWIGMTGVIFILHFGSLKLLALIWQQLGIPAAPLMRNPILSTSLAEFWSERWNTAFNFIARDLLFRRMYRRLGISAATLSVFFVSGLIHDLIISVPAGAGFGLPTAYFLLQGAGLLFERSPLGRKLGLARGVRGRAFTIALTALPAFWLFHPPFVRNVILPMLDAIGAT